MAIERGHGLNALQWFAPEIEAEPVEHFGALVGRSPATHRLFSQLRRVAATDRTVLIEGETGTGKGLVAQALIAKSERAQRPLLWIECDGASANELDLELFGHEGGAYVTARAPGPGALAAAAGGVVVLDEVAALPMTAQARLLRAIESGAVQRIGGNSAQPLDVRIVAMTREDLAARCEQGLFRRDLYFCLRALRVRVPPLRERLEDLSLLVAALAPEVGCAPERYRSPALAAWLMGRRWPGNVRELRNMLQRVGLIGLDEVISEPEDPPAASGPSLPRTSNAFFDARQELVERFEHEYVLRLLRVHAGNVTQAAKAAHQTPSWFWRRIRRFGIDVDQLRWQGSDAAGHKAAS
jgi:two-component system response regulator GlrR